MHPADPGRPSGFALARYAVAWVSTGVVVATLLILALRGCSDDQLPPLRRSDLADAARAGRCSTLRTTDAHPGNPPAGGRAAPEPVAPGTYEDAPSVPRLIAAVRRGAVVIHYRAPLDGDRLQQLRLIQEVVPKATIVTVNATRMPFPIAAVAWHRVIGCRTVSAAALEAVRLFRARNIGRGPDARP